MSDLAPNQYKYMQRCLLVDRSYYSTGSKVHEGGGTEPRPLDIYDRALKCAFRLAAALSSASKRRLPPVRPPDTSWPPTGSVYGWYVTDIKERALSSHAMDAQQYSNSRYALIPARALFNIFDARWSKWGEQQHLQALLVHEQDVLHPDMTSNTPWLIPGKKYKSHTCILRRTLVFTGCFSYFVSLCSLYTRTNLLHCNNLQ